MYTDEIVHVYQTRSASWLFVNIAVYTVLPFVCTVIYDTAVYTRTMTEVFIMVFISLRLLLYTAVYTVSQPERY